MSNDNDQPTGLDSALALEDGNQVDYFQVAAALERQLAAVEAERDRLASEVEYLRPRAHVSKEGTACGNCHDPSHAFQIPRLQLEVVDVGLRLAAAETDRNHAIATLVSAAACLADAGFKGETVREQVGEAVAAIEQMKAERDDLQSSLAWVVEAVIRHHDIVATPNYEAWLKRAKECGKQWRERAAEDYDLITELRGDVTRLEADNARLRQRVSDNPEYDATDAAHPAYWRGHDHATAIFCQHVTEILDGKDDGAGVNTEPWGTVRRRLLELKASHDNWREAAEAEIEITRRLTMLSDGIYDLSLSVADEFKDGNILDTFRRVIEERNALRQQVRKIGETVKAKAVSLLEYQCEIAEENHVEFGVCNGIQIALNTINSSLDLAACGAKVEEAGDKLGENHPLAHLFGKYDNDPVWPDFQAAIDADPDVIEGPPPPSEHEAGEKRSNPTCAICGEPLAITHGFLHHTTMRPADVEDHRAVVTEQTVASPVQQENEGNG